MCGPDRSAPAWPHYKPLREGEIRLLTIESQTSLTLEHVKLADNPRYDAVSYRWGDDGDTALVQVDKHEMQVSQTVYDLLGSLFRKYCTIRIWLDQICINQQDNSEKSKQVMLMGRIYNTAMSVYAWLGQATAETDFVFDALLSFQEQKKENSSLISNLDDAEERSFWHALFDDICERRAGHARESSVEDDPHVRPEVNWLRPVFSNPYWQRLWIVQELVLAKSIVVFCGDKFVDFDAIYGLSASEGSLEQAFRLGIFRCMKSKGLAAMHTICGHRHRTACDHPDCKDRLICKKGATVEEAIEIYASNHECGCPHDKVYGLRTLVSEWEAVDVDYEKPLVKVFQDVACASKSRSTGSDKHKWWNKQTGWDKRTALKLSRSLGLLDSETASIRGEIED